SLLTQCNGQEKKGKSINMQSQIEQFNKQKNRLEFKEEKLFYNDKHVKLDQSMAYYEAVFGKDYSVNINDIVVYNNLPISMNKGIDDQVDNIRIQLYYYDQKMLMHKSDNETWGFPPKILDNEYILIDVVPLNKDTDINVFNDMLINSNKQSFKQKFKGVDAVSRQYLNENDMFSITISISKGELTPLDYILYSDGSTTSE
ncbi:DUF7738 domain-containing protein, partial [Bizionia paragorgiae]